ncbi:MAG: hypothetical protein AAGH65_04850 [Pseudomonadota bacterium]
MTHSTQIVSVRSAVWSVVMCACVFTSATHATDAACDLGQPHPEAPSQLDQFAFLIGFWKIDLFQMQGEAWSPPRPNPAYWTGRYALGGMAIYDEWFDVDPTIDPNTPRGANLRAYDRASNQWQMTWLHTGANTPTDLTAALRGEHMVMWQNHPETPPWEAEFVIHSNDHWTRTHYNLTEDGTRSAQFKLEARRIVCPRLETPVE